MNPRSVSDLSWGPVNGNTNTFAQWIVDCLKLAPGVLPNNTEILNLSEGKSRLLCYKQHIVQWNALQVPVVSLQDLEAFKVAVSKLQHSKP